MRNAPRAKIAYGKFHAVRHLYYVRETACGKINPPSGAVPWGGTTLSNGRSAFDYPPDVVFVEIPRRLRCSFEHVQDLFRVGPEDP